MISTYSKRKNEVLNSYEKLNSFIQELRNYAKENEIIDPLKSAESLVSDIQYRAQKVKEDRFSIIVAGESKSGKSTFINAYLGVEILPMHIKQCTSSLIKIKNGKEFKLKATYAGIPPKYFMGEEATKKFLIENASLDDKYREIPVPTINSEIIVKAGLRSVHNKQPLTLPTIEIENFLNAQEVIEANIYNKPQNEYRNLIRQYIENKLQHWKEIVTEIEVDFPFSDEDMQGIEIIDSPGVCARGGVAQITKDYIKNADAIIFLKPIVGQALESLQFDRFMETSSVSRNKNALFLVLTHITTKTESELQSSEEEAHKIFSSKLPEQHILFVDSKAELYANKFQNMNSLDEIKQELKLLKQKEVLDDFVVTAFNETSGLFGDSNSKDDFISILKTKSRFNEITSSLERFGRSAHYLLLHDLLTMISKLYEKIFKELNTTADLFKQKAEDPLELAGKIADIKKELDEIRTKLSRKTDEIVHSFDADDGVIRTEAEKQVALYLDEIDKLKRSDFFSTDGQDPLNLLEKISMEKIDMVKEFTKKLKNDVLEKLDSELTKISDKTSIDFITIQPCLTSEDIQKIIEKTRSESVIWKDEGICFEDYHSYYDPEKHFENVKKGITDRFNEIKEELINNCCDFVMGVREKYIEELKKISKIKKENLDSVIEAKKTAEQTEQIIKALLEKAQQALDIKSDVDKLNGGIAKHVYTNK